MLAGSKIWKTVKKSPVADQATGLFFCLQNSILEAEFSLVLKK